MSTFRVTVHVDEAHRLDTLVEVLNGLAGVEAQEVEVQHVNPRSTPPIAWQLIWNSTVGSFEGTP
jgi:hypothetical protein